MRNLTTEELIELEKLNTDWFKQHGLLVEGWTIELVMRPVRQVALAVRTEPTVKPPVATGDLDEFFAQTPGSFPRLPKRQESLKSRFFTIGEMARWATTDEAVHGFGAGAKSCVKDELRKMNVPIDPVAAMGEKEKSAIRNMPIGVWRMNPRLVGLREAQSAAALCSKCNTVGDLLNLLKSKESVSALCEGRDAQTQIEFHHFRGRLINIGLIEAP
jgi:hypothetical protein